MALSKEIYEAFSNILGPRNISDDPAILESYRYPLTGTSNHIGPFFRVSTPLAEAVLLPENVEEVQKIIKLCNKHKIKFKASSTFWGAMGYPSTENTIQLDMSRMSRIIEIDRKNMFAIIEPGVIAGNLQAELMKLGLNFHLIGAGASCSPLASATSYLGPGADTISMGNTSENLLALEWVMPDGEIMRTGSLGSGLGWFSGEGPGPSVRGIVRGAQGAKGAMGVFTKCAIKLHPWPGPDKLPVEGIIPAYKIYLPNNFKAYTVAFPSWEKWADATHKIWDAELGYIAHRQFAMFGRDLKAAMIKILTDPTKTLSDLDELLKDPSIQRTNEEMKHDFQIILAGMTPMDIEWKEKALDDILSETEGWKVAAMSESDIAGWSMLYLIRLGHKNLNLVYGGGYDGCFGLKGPPDFGTAWVEDVAKFKIEWESKGNIVNSGGDGMIGGLGGIGGGGGCTWENFVHFDPHDEGSTKGTYDFFEACTNYARENNLPSGMERLNFLCRGADGREIPKVVREKALSMSKQAAAYRYQNKIREIFNPNDLGDAYYHTLGN